MSTIDLTPYVNEGAVRDYARRYKTRDPFSHVSGRLEVLAELASLIEHDDIDDASIHRRHSQASRDLIAMLVRPDVPAEPVLPAPLVVREREAHQVRVRLEAMEPDALPATHGLVEWSPTGDVSNMGDEVEVRGTRANVERFIRDHWGDDEIDSYGSVDEYFRLRDLNRIPTPESRRA